MTKAWRWRSRAALRRTAIHEAGHAIIAEALGMGCAAITVVPDYQERTAGFVLSETGWDLAGIWDARGRWRYPSVALHAQAIQLLAGAAAEREMLGYANAGDANDRREVSRLIYSLGKSGPAAEQLARRLEQFTCGLVRRHRLAITDLADILLTHKVMVGEVLAETMERLLPSSLYLARHGAWARTQDAMVMAMEHGITVDDGGHNGN